MYLIAYKRNIHKTKLMNIIKYKKNHLIKQRLKVQRCFISKHGTLLMGM